MSGRDPQPGDLYRAWLEPTDVHVGAEFISDGYVIMRRPGWLTLPPGAYQWYATRSPTPVEPVRVLHVDGVDAACRPYWDTPSTGPVDLPGVTFRHPVDGRAVEVVLTVDGPAYVNGRLVRHFGTHGWTTAGHNLYAIADTSGERVAILLGIRDDGRLDATGRRIAAAYTTQETAR